MIRSDTTPGRVSAALSGKLAYCAVPNLECLNPPPKLATDQNGYAIDAGPPRLRWRCRWCDKAACRNHRSGDRCLTCLDSGGPAGLGICVKHRCPEWAVVIERSEDCPGNFLCGDHRSDQ